jgi:hypothetical protein
MIKKSCDESKEAWSIAPIGGLSPYLPVSIGSVTICDTWQLQPLAFCLTHAVHIDLCSITVYPLWRLLSSHFEMFRQAGSTNDVQYNVDWLACYRLRRIPWSGGYLSMDNESVTDPSLPDANCCAGRLIDCLLAGRLVQEHWCRKLLVQVYRKNWKP